MSALSPARRPDPPSPADEAARGLYERYADPIFGFCLKRLGSREEAEDATQTTFLQALRALRNSSVPRSESAWLYRIAENVCRRRRSQPDAVVAQGLVDAAAAPALPELDRLALEEALKRLPEAQRRAILLREVRGLSYREIAAELGVGNAAVEALIFRARRSLAAALDPPQGRARASSGVPLLPALKSLLGGAAVAAKGAAVFVAVGGALLAAGELRRPAVDTKPTAVVPTSGAAAEPADRTAPSAQPGVALRPATVPAAPEADRPAPAESDGSPRDVAERAAPSTPPSADAPSPKTAGTPAAAEPPSEKAPSAAPLLELPAVELPAVELPAVELPAVDLPPAELPAVELPEAKLPPVEVPSVSVPLEEPSVDLPPPPALEPPPLPLDQIAP